MKTIKNIIDLTYDVEEGMLTFNAPWHPVVSIKQLGRIGVEGRESREISFGSHTGTHVDAPLHFIKNGKTIDKIPVDRLIGNVTILDFSYLKKNEPVTKEMLVKNNISKKIVFKFGWGKFWGTKQFYFDYPHFTKESAEYLVSKDVEMISYDTPSPDSSNTKIGSKEDSQIHKIFLKNEIILVEYLANLDKVTKYDGWNIVVLPMKIKGCDGSPARVILYK